MERLGEWRMKNSKACRLLMSALVLGTLGAAGGYHVWAEEPEVIDVSMGHDFLKRDIVGKDLIIDQGYVDARFSNSNSRNVIINVKAQDGQGDNVYFRNGSANRNAENYQVNGSLLKVTTEGLAR